MSPNGWLFLGTCVTAVVTIGVGGFTAWSARSTARVQAKVQEAKVSVEAKSADIESLRKIIGEQNEYIDRVQGWHDECEQRCTDCRQAKDEMTAENAEIRAENRRLTAQVGRLETRVTELEEAQHG